MFANKEDYIVIFENNESKIEARPQAFSNDEFRFSFSNQGSVVLSTNEIVAMYHYSQLYQVNKNK